MSQADGELSSCCRFRRRLHGTELFGSGFQQRSAFKSAAVVVVRDLPGPILTQLGACVRGLMKLKAARIDASERKTRVKEDKFHEAVTVSCSLSVLPAPPKGPRSSNIQPGAELDRERPPTASRRRFGASTGILLVIKLGITLKWPRKPSGSTAVGGRLVVSTLVSV